MNKEYKIKLDLNKKLYNKKMAFNQFDENVNDFYIEVTKNNKVVKDLDKSIVTLVAIKPNGEVDAQFIEVKEGQIYANLKPSMCDLVGNYQAKAMIVLEGEIVTTDTINYSVNEDKIISRLNDDIVSDERFTLFTDALARLSTIEISEEQRIVNEAERILSEENRKIEEAKRVESELIRQHEEADRSKYDAIRESNENIRKQNESIRLANEVNRKEEELKRVEEENKRKLAEEERNANYNFMTEDEERRRSEANAHKEAEVSRVQAETNRVNEEAKRRATEQGRVSAENTRVSNENTREANEVTRQTNETQRVEAETQRQNRYNSFIVDAEANANNFENYTNNAKVKEEERKANELDRKSQEVQRISNENERISNENTRKANEVAREKNETSRQNIFENKVDEVDKKIIEINTTKDNFISSINTKVDNKISEIEVAKSDMTTTVSNKVNEVETRFNALTSKQQQDAEVIDARDGETSLKARLDRDIEKVKQVYVNVEGSHISTDSADGYLKDVEIKGNTIQDAENLADIRSVGDKVEGQELYEIPVLIRGKNLFNPNSPLVDMGSPSYNNAREILVRANTYYAYTSTPYTGAVSVNFYKSDDTLISSTVVSSGQNFSTPVECKKIRIHTAIDSKVQLEEGTQATPYEPYQEDKLTILSPVQLEKVGDVRDRIICKDGVWGVEKNVGNKIIDGVNIISTHWKEGTNTIGCLYGYSDERVLARDTYIGVISCELPSKSYIDLYSYDVEGISGYTNNQYGFVVRINKAKLNGLTTKEYFNQNPLTVKYQLAQPQFIPLPHDQQIKLRTFAGQTNIHFETEIEGTIKAQVPKSLGATVNTHTEQINNLNKELDRVKKLEESTVSTVETEGDFTTVEATSNGYFEDVKLEGKTLVNLAPKNLGQFTYTSRVSNLHFYDVPYSGTFKPSTTYTYVLNIIENTFDKYIMRLGDTYEKVEPTIWASNQVIESKTGIIAFTLTTKEVIDSSLKDNRCYISGSNESDKKLVFSLMILEGDHTQNPPSYFEGLKSVGQDTDEISVESVNENLFDMSSKYEDALMLEDGSKIDTQDWRLHDFIKVKPNGTYYLCDDGLNFYQFLVALYDSNKNFIGRINRQGDDSRVYTMPSNAFYCRINYSVSVNSTPIVRSNIMFNKGTTRKPYTPHQSDRKRLLFYNNETQTWEKPILRQWDSIEKHADGKYYYHQRSGEIVLNGSENWVDRSSNYISDTQTRFSIAFNTKPCSNTVVSLICDKYRATLTIPGMTSVSENGICSNVQGSMIYVTVPKTTLAEFKTTLEANPVTVVYQLAQEKVYECTNIDLITYANETNYVVNSGAIVPRTTLKVHNNISNVVSLLQKKVSLLESNVTSYMITQNRLMLASRYNADTVSFKVDVATLRNSFEYDNDLYELILNNILVGKDNYNREYIENLIIFYWMDFIISDEMYSTLFEIIEEQHNPKVIEEAPIE